MKKRFLLMGAALVLVISTVVGGSLAAVQVSGDQAVAAQLNTKSLTIALSELAPAAAQAVNVDVKGNLMPGDVHAFPQQADGNVQITNTGNVNAYVRVTLNVYWTDEKGTRMDAEGVTLKAADNSGWLKADALFSDLGTGEVSQVFYYTKPLSQGEQTDLLLGELELDNGLPNDYQGLQLHIEAVADGVQYAAGHNDVNANGILSSWGVSAALDDGGNITSITQ